MSARLRRAGRFLARVAALIVALLLVGGLALRLWVHHRIAEAGEAFLEAFGPEAASDAGGPSDENGGPWLRAAALVVRLEPSQSRQIDAWSEAGAELSAADVQQIEGWLERDRLALELITAAAGQSRIRLFTDPDLVELEKMAVLPQAQSLGELARLLVAEELVRRAREDWSGACSSLERLGRLALGLQGGRYLLEQQLVELPESLLFHRLQALLAQGVPVPCAAAVADLVTRLDHSLGTRTAMIEEGRWLLRPQRLLVLPANDRARTLGLVDLLLSSPGSSLTRADLLDSTRVALEEDRSDPQPVDGEPGARWRDLYRVVLRLAEVADDKRRLAATALALRVDLESGEGPGRKLAAELERAVPTGGERISVRATGPRTWAIELERADAIAAELQLPSRSAQLLRWMVVAPRPTSP